MRNFFAPGKMLLYGDQMGTPKNFSVRGFSAGQGASISSQAARPIWTPAQITGAIVFDALDSARITLDGSAVTAWADMLGSGITAAQSTPASQPSMGTDEVVFASDYLTISGSKSAAWCKALHSTGGHIFAIVKFGTSSNPGTLYALAGTIAVSSSEIGFYIGYDDRAAQSRNDAIAGMVARGVGGQTPVNVAHNNVITPNALQIISVALDPDNATAADRFGARINEDSVLAGNSSSHAPSTSDATYDVQIGAVGGAIPLTGSIRVVAFLPLISDDDRLRMAGWAAHRHGLASLLPSNHPYKYDQPYLE